jgi:hypothetical protein
MRNLLKPVLLLVAVCLLVSAVPAFARNVAMRAGAIQIFVPDTWVNSFDTTVVSTESPDGGVAVVFTILQNEQLDDALAEAEASIVEAVGPIAQNGDALDFTVNGMPATMQKGVSRNGQNSFSLTMILTPNKRWLMIMYVGSRNQEAFWRKDLGEILKSVKPL